MLSDSPPERDLEWTEAGIEGAARFVQRVWRLATTDSSAEGEDEALDRRRHRVIAAVTEALDGLQFNKAVAQLYELTTAIEKAKPSASRSAAIRTLVQLAAPAAPHLAEEAWAALGGETMVVDARWPEFNPAMLVEDQVTLAIRSTANCAIRWTHRAGSTGRPRKRSRWRRKRCSVCSRAMSPGK